MKKYALLFSLLLLLGACTATPSSTTTIPTTSDQTGSQTLTTYTTTTLVAFNGQNGAKAYIAVGGKVYDVSNVSQWRNGSHKGYTAGVDLTAAFANSPHTDSLLASLKVVGTFTK